MEYLEMYTDQDVKEAEENGIDYKNFYNRVTALGWTIERAKTQPVKKKTQDHGDYPKRARENGISEVLYYMRVNHKKWSRERACTEPPMTKEQASEHKRKLFTGKSKYDWYLKTALSNGISKTAFYQRVSKGKMTLEEASTIPTMNKRECALYRTKKHKKKGDKQPCII